MAITFNNIPTTVRTPGAYIEVDNSRALKGLVTNPHKTLIIGQKIAGGTAELETLYAISSDGLADGYFGAGSILGRMCNVFKDNNPNTELYAIALSNDGGVKAKGYIRFNSTYSTTATTAYYLMINGVKLETTLTSGWSAQDIHSAIEDKINADSTLPVTASASASAAASLYHVELEAVQSGTLGNYINVRHNYYAGESLPAGFSASAVSIISMTGGTVDPDLGDAWAIIDGEQYHYIVQPYIDAANLTEIEDELTDRFKPLEDLQGHGFTAVRATQASCTTLGNTRNNAHNTIIGAHDSPTCPEEWAAALGAQASFNLNNDPARPLHTLQLKGILPPPEENRFNRAERDILLYDGIATFTVSTGNVLIERCITTYQTNALGITDTSYLDVQTLATLSEIRYQYKTRMVNRFIVPRFKLADDTFPVQPGSKVASPKTVKQETIALFSLLRDRGLIENLDDFIENLVVERNATDVNRVDVLLPPDLINQFRILAGVIQFIL